MVSFENDKSKSCYMYYYMYTLSSEQKHLIVDQAEAKEISARREQHNTTCAALQLKLTHGAFANQQDDWPRLAAATSSSSTCMRDAHGGAELT